MSLYLNLGCGNKLEPGDEWLNIDLVKPPTLKDENFRRGDLLALPIDDQSVDGIKMLHVLEHIAPCDFEEVMEELWRVSKPGAWLHLEMPNIYTSCASVLAAIEKKDVQLYMLGMRSVYGSHEQPGQNHKWGYSPESLIPLLEFIGWTNVTQADLASPLVSAWDALGQQLINDKRLTEEEAFVFITCRTFAVKAIRGEGAMTALPKVIATGGIKDGLLGYPTYVR